MDQLVPSYVDIHKNNKNKASDKGIRYLREYDRLFAPFRNKPVNILEIGVQNGGSLEVMAQYFTHKETHITGCDIHPKCADLKFSDPRIKVFVADATQAKTQEKISRHTPHLDIVIDDGSHMQKDVIRAFALYWPMLKDGGLYIVEDMHTGHMQHFGGSVTGSNTSQAFFKALTDVMTGVHSGALQASLTVLRENFYAQNDINITQEDLMHLHSLTFINSMVIIQKKAPHENTLGQRIVPGKEAIVWPGVFDVNAYKK